MKIVFSNHALERIKWRKIKQEVVFEIIKNPDSVIAQSEKIRVYSKIVDE